MSEDISRRGICQGLAALLAAVPAVPATATAGKALEPLAGLWRPKTPDEIVGDIRYFWDMALPGSEYSACQKLAWNGKEWKLVACFSGSEH